MLTVQEACDALHIGKNSLYRLLKMGAIRSIKIGKKYIIPKVCLLDFVNSYRVQ
ncbi:MAG: helix-turn-helix domain-containing protein [Candidatus Fimenecus sp.]